MTSELQLLVGAIVIGLAQIFIAAQAATAQRGLKWNLSARDAVQAPLTGVAARLDRALQNFKETFPLFAAAVLAASVMHLHTSMTVLGANLYVWARLVYLPIYAAGVPVVRTLVWGVSTIGIVLLLVALIQSF